MPKGVERDRVVFTYIDPGMGTRTELHSWGAAHRRLGEKLRESGRRIDVVGVVCDQHCLDRAERVLQSWTARDISEAETELLALRQAVAQADGDTVERHGGHDAAMRKFQQGQEENPMRKGRGSIDDFRLWGSRRWRRTNAPPKKPRWRTWVARDFTPPTLFSQRAPLAVVVESSPKPRISPVAVASPAIEASVMGEGEGSGGG